MKIESDGNFSSHLATSFINFFIFKNFFSANLIKNTDNENWTFSCQFGECGMSGNYDEISKLLKIGEQTFIIKPAIYIAQQTHEKCQFGKSKYLIVRNH